MKQIDTTSEKIGSNLTNLQAIAVPYLLEGHTIAETANLAGCSVSTVNRWLADINFQNVLSAGREAAWRIAAGKLSLAAEGSVDRLVELRDNEDTPPSIRLKAATEILSLRHTISSQIELNDRLTLLEVNLNG